MTKTYFAEEITNYINCCIEDMASSYQYYADDTVLMHGVKNAGEWYRDYLEDEKNRGFGALQASYIFFKVIDKATYEDLDNRLSEACNYWYEKSWEIKEAD